MINRNKEIQQTEQNNIILSQMFADEIKRARDQRYPKAEDLI